MGSGTLSGSLVCESKSDRPASVFSQGLPDPHTVSSSIQQMWALTEVMQTNQTTASIGRFDVSLTHRPLLPSAGHQVTQAAWCSSTERVCWLCVTSPCFTLLPLVTLLNHVTMFLFWFPWCLHVFVVNPVWTACCVVFVWSCRETPSV